jgi:hypothetical protein
MRPKRDCYSNGLFGTIRLVLVRDVPRAAHVFVLALVALSLATNIQAQSSPGGGDSAGQPSAEQLQQLVTPIALYPDSLVAQILAASQYPTQIVEAARWVQQNSSLSGSQLQSAIAKQPWDPSVMAVAQFPSVLNNMNANLSWLSALGDAYYHEPQSVMQAIQVLRQKAYQAGHLKTTPQQTVTVESGAGQTTTTSGGGNQTIIIEPSNPQVVYVPTYNPTTVYGTPTQVYPGYNSADLLATSLLSFGVGMAVGAAVSGGGGWGCNWGGGNVTYNNNTYIAHNSVYGPNRWGGYNPYNPYHPYSPYSSYHPYNPAYHPYNPAYHPYNSAYHPYNPAYHPNETGYHPYENTGSHPYENAASHPYGQNPASHPYGQNAASHPYGQSAAYHPTSSGFHGASGSNLNNYRGFDNHGSTGLENQSAFHGFGGGGDTRMASERGFSVLAAAVDDSEDLAAAVVSMEGVNPHRAGKGWRFKTVHMPKGHFKVTLCQKQMRKFIRISL